MLQFVNKLKIRARKSRIAKNLQIGKVQEKNQKDEKFVSLNQNLLEKEEKKEQISPPKDLNKSVAIIKLEKITPPTEEKSAENLKIQSIEDFAKYVRPMHRTATGISHLYQQQSSIPNLNHIEHTEYLSREMSSTKLDQIQEEDSSDETKTNSRQ